MKNQGSRIKDQGSRIKEMSSLSIEIGELISPDLSRIEIMSPKISNEILDLSFSSTPPSPSSKLMEETKYLLKSLNINTDFNKTGVETVYDMIMKNFGWENKEKILETLIQILKDENIPNNVEYNKKNILDNNKGNNIKFYSYCYDDKITIDNITWSVFDLIFSRNFNENVNKRLLNIYDKKNNIGIRRFKIIGNNSRCDVKNKETVEIYKEKCKKMFNLSEDKDFIILVLEANFFV